MAIFRRLYLCFLVPLVAEAVSSSSEVVVVDILSLLGSGSCVVGGGGGGGLAIFVSGVSGISMFLAF